MNECIFCGGKIVKNGKTHSGEQEYCCRICDSYFTSNTNVNYPGGQFDIDTMNLSVLWYYRFKLSLRNVAEMMMYRGIDVSHQSVSRWVHEIGGKMAKRAHESHGKKRKVSWYVDETYIRVKGSWKYLYRAVDRSGDVLDVMLSAHRSKKAAKRFFKKTLKVMGVKPERIYTDKNSAFPKANKEVLGAKHGILHIAVTPVERSHVPVKSRISAMRGFGNFWNAYNFTRNFEYIYGYLGYLNASTRAERINVFQKSERLIKRIPA